jgi:two-component system, NarL family, response regulator DevR
MIKILIADENYIARSGLFTILTNQPDFEVVGVTTDYAKICRDVRVNHPDVIIFDIHSQFANSVDVIRDCCQIKESKLLLLVDDVDDPCLIHYLRAGAQGCIQKSMGEKYLLQSIREIADDYSPISPNIAFKLLQYLRNIKEENISLNNSDSTLSQRELVVLKLLSEGLPNKMIGSQLGISERTVEAHVRNILKKINATSRTHAAFIAAKKGWLPVNN